jgi:hypothetical protein
MRPLAFASLLFILSTCASAHQPQSPAAEKPATATISGTIMCDDTRAPARNAVVRLVPVPAIKLNGPKPRRSTDINSTLQTTTDIYGHYKLTGVLPGDYILLPVYSGYLSDFDLTLQPGETPLSTTTLVAAAKRSGITIAAGAAVTANHTMTRGAAIAGRVLYSDGTPAPHISVQVEDAATSEFIYNPRNSGVNDSELVTDDMGRYRIPSVLPGAYYVSILIPRQDGSKTGTVFEEEDKSTLLLYSGDTFRRASAKRYEVHPHDEVTNVDFTLPLGTLRTVGGSVIAKDGTPLNWGKITLTDTTDGEIELSEFVSPDGTFTVSNVPPATYTIEFKGMAVMKHNSKLEMGGSKSWVSRVRTFADSKQTIIVGDADPAPINITPAETALDPAVAKREAEVPPETPR